MTWIDDILIIGGISLDIFAAVECKGSVVSKIDKKQLTVICGFAVLWQLAALALGYELSGLLYRNRLAQHERFAGLVLAAGIFFALGIRLMVKAVKNRWLNESREDGLEWKSLLHIAGAAGLYTLITGMAFGFLGKGLGMSLLLIVAMTIIVVITGMYTGYHLGFVHKRKAYISGAILLWLAGADIVIRYII
jgi:putative Mn2+ efflux pump MntP